MLLHVTDDNIESHNSKGLRVRPARHVSLNKVHGLFRKVAKTNVFCCLVHDDYKTVLGIETQDLSHPERESYH
jgi:hypothetical protein